MGSVARLIGDIWRIFERFLEHCWTTFRKRFGICWATSGTLAGRILGNCWAAVGKRLRALERILKQCVATFGNGRRAFWRLLDTDKRFNPNRDKYSIERLYSQQKWPLVLDELIQRIYLVRCQLVHGAATHDSSLNRETVRRCATMLNHLLFSIVSVITDHGISENWDDLCYPPVVESPIHLKKSNPR